MIYKLQNGGVVKLQNAWTTIPKSEDVILRSWERQRQKEMQSTSTGRASGIHNTDLPLQTEYPEAVVFGGAKAIKTVPHVLSVIMNPATASTTAGAVTATGLDAIGLVTGLNNLDNYRRNWQNLTFNDTPGIILNGLSLIPGSSQLTNYKNLKYLTDATKNGIRTISRPLVNRWRTSVYNNLMPFSYNETYLQDGKKYQEFTNAIKDFITPKRIVENPKWQNWATSNGIPGYFKYDWKDADKITAIRQEIYKRYLGMKSPEHFYIKNSDGAYSYNFDNLPDYVKQNFIDAVSNKFRGFGKGVSVGDYLGSAGEILSPSGTKNNMRNAIVRYGRRNGADAVEFRGIADNQLQNQNILFATNNAKFNKTKQFLFGRPNNYEAPMVQIKSLAYEDPIMADTEHLPKTWTWKDDFLNSELFQGASDKSKSKFFEYLRPYLKQDPQNLSLYIKDQTDAPLIEDYLRLVVDEKNNGKLPFGIVFDKDIGLFRRLPGNLQEIATQYHGIDSGLIKPLSDFTTRSHNVKHVMGVGALDDAFYSGFGDSGLVLPYTNREMLNNGHFKFIDLYRSPKDVYDYYNKMASELYRLRSSFDTNIKSAFKAGDYEKAAKLYAQRMAHPILDQPYLIDRATRIKSGTGPMLDADSKIANQEIRRMLRSTLEGSVDTSNIKSFNFRPLISKEGVVNFADPNFSIFTGDPSKLHENVIGGYYLQSSAPLYEPNIPTLRSWTFKGKDKSAFYDAIVKDGQKFPSNWKLDSDRIIKFYDAPVSIHVGDFHHPSNNVILPEQLPRLLMVPKDQIGKHLFRFDRYKLGLKKGGKINDK